LSPRQAVRYRRARLWAFTWGAPVLVLAYWALLKWGMK